MDHFLTETIMLRIDISMPNCVQITLQKLDYKCNTKSQYAPHKWAIHNYGKNMQFTMTDDTSPILYKSMAPNTHKELLGRFYTTDMS